VIITSHGAVDGSNYFEHVSVNAYFDANGIPTGHMSWEGSVTQSLPMGNIGPGGPSDPFIIDVTDLLIVGNTAYVGGIVVSSPKGVGDGIFVSFAFTDNSAIGEPDELDGMPVDSGNYTVKD
jgi:hypothetical protein